jgi:hypothetical protein
MHPEYQIRWISKQRAEAVKKAGLGRAVLLDNINGFLIVEPVGSDLGDGKVLSEREADYELQPVWCTGPKAQLREVRRRLGLGSGSLAGELAGSGA